MRTFAFPAEPSPGGDIGLFVEQDGSEGFTVYLSCHQLAAMILLLGESYLDFYEAVGQSMVELDSV